MWHFRVIHFPIALLLVGFLMEILSYSLQGKNWRFASLSLLFLGAMGSIAAVATGLWIESEHNDPLLETHRLLALSCMASTIAAAFAHFLSFKVNWMRYLRTFFYAIAALLVIITGHYGGTMSHGQGDDNPPSEQGRSSGIIQIQPPKIPPKVARKKPPKQSP